VAAAAPGALPQGHRTLAIKVDALERRYVVHVPRGYNGDKHWPVVIMFHGGGGTAWGAMQDTGWVEKAEKEGFLAVFPEGTAPDPARAARFRDNPQTWNDGSRRPNVGAVLRGVDDVKFVSLMLADLKTRCTVDESRIYATGFSNGASMTFRLARELSPLIAAAAPVAGADWLDGKPQRPVPLLFMTGTADPLNPLAGGEIKIGQKAFGTKPSARETIEKWVQLHGAPGDGSVVHDKDGATGVAYGRAGGPARVVLYTIDGHGHHWPGRDSALPVWLAGKNTAKLNATDVIWEFFKQHTQSEATAAQHGAAAGAAKPCR
jgi:polyhydroxybutyrate depolymerase